MEETAVVLFMISLGGITVKLIRDIVNALKRYRKTGEGK